MRVQLLTEPGRFSARVSALIVIFFLAMVLEAAAFGRRDVVVWTQHNNNARTGSNTREKVLSTQNVNAQQFGKLFSYPLDDESYSQPLYVPGLKMSADHQKHNVVFVATVNDTVYAWDADRLETNGGKPLWSRSLIPAGARPPNVLDLNKIGVCDGEYHDFAGNFGIVGTPVIDVHSKTIYVVARTVEANGGFAQRLHALDIASGEEKFHGPALITATYEGIAFNPQLQNQRAALALVKDVVYIAWASHCDFGGRNGLPDYHGWVMGYKATDLSQVSAWNDTAAKGGAEGGIWQAGQGITADRAGNLYITSGNGSWDGEKNFGSSIVKLSIHQQRVEVASFFTPWNYLQLNSEDLDVGAAGLLLIPGTKRILAASKQGFLYLMDANNLGGNRAAAPDAVIQEFQATFPIAKGGHIHGSPVYLKTASGEYVYVWGESDFLRVFEYRKANAALNATPVALSSMRAPQVQTGMPGGFLSVSSDGTSNGIIWALTPFACNANDHVQAGILYAFDASHFRGSGTTRMLAELWDSRQNAERDDVGYFAKFTYPTVVNGKVYVSSWGHVPEAGRHNCAGAEVPPHEGQLCVYGVR